MINTREALNIIEESVHPLGTITLFFEHALGFILAEDVVSDENIPSFDNSAMDGYALRSEDCKTVPTVLKIVDEMSAGVSSSRTIEQGECASIMTGAKIPTSCDAVIQHEWTERISQQQGGR